MTQENANVNVDEVVENSQQDTEQTSNEPKTFTEEEVQAIVKERVDRQKATFSKTLKEERTKAVNEYKESVAEAERIDKLSETERLNEELAKANEQLQELKAKQQRSDMLSASRSELNKIGLDVSDEVLNFVTTDDAETTLDNIKALEKLIENQRVKWESERAKGTTPQNLSSNSEGADPFAALANKYK